MVKTPASILAVSNLASHPARQATMKIGDNPDNTVNPRAFLCTFYRGFQVPIAIIRTDAKDFSQR
jgi:hypothetical protein